MTYCGGLEEVSIAKQPLGKKIICLTLNLSNIFFFIILSCVVYCAVLRRRGLLGIIKVDVDPEGLHINRLSHTSMGPKDASFAKELDSSAGLVLKTQPSVVEN